MSTENYARSVEPLSVWEDDDGNLTIEAGDADADPYQSVKIPAGQIQDLAEWLAEAVVEIAERPVERLAAANAEGGEPR